jgi:hypothetical protein
VRPSRTASITLAVAALALGGCGDEEAAETTAGSSTTATTAVTGGDDPAKSPACNAASAADVRSEVARAGGPDGQLELTANDSLDLSVCEYRERSGGDVYVKVTLDTAPQAERRYTIQLEEGRQRATFDAIPDSSKPIGVRGVGDDSVAGGIGAYWTKLTSQLTAIEDGELAKVAVHAAGVGEDRAQAAATALARTALDG